MNMKAPKPQDPITTAGQQTATNIGTAIAQQQMNNINQVTPDGSLTYNQSGTYQYKDPLNGQSYDIPTYTATQKLSDIQNKINDTNQGAELNLSNLAKTQSGKLEQYLNNPFDVNSLGEAPQFSNESFSKDRLRTEQALMERLNPQLNGDRERTEGRLAQQGIRIGSQAYDSAMSGLDRQANDARLGAIINAGEEQSRNYNMQLSGRNNALQEKFAVRSQPINEITALLSGSQVNNPNFVNTQSAQIANTDYAGIRNASDNLRNSQFQGKMGLISNLVGGAMSAGAAAFSDRRVKKDISKVGKTKDGQNIYSYRYKNETKQSPLRMGLMAQEVEKIKPEAVTSRNGIKMVNYDKALKK